MTRCYLAFAAFAAALGYFSNQPIERCWGAWAAAGYAVAAAVIGLGHGRRARTAAVAPAHAVALACATIGPLAWQAWAGLPSRVGEGSLTVIAQAGSRLLAHGTPYLPAGSLSRVLAYDHSAHSRRSAHPDAAHVGSSHRHRLRPQGDRLACPPGADRHPRRHPGQRARGPLRRARGADRGRRDGGVRARRAA